MKTATSRKETVVNEVNVDELFKTVDAVGPGALPRVRHRISPCNGFGGTATTIVSVNAVFFPHIHSAGRPVAGNVTKGWFPEQQRNWRGVRRSGHGGKF